MFEGIEYEYRVACENEAGLGAFKTIGPVMAQDMIGKCGGYLVSAI